MREIKFRAWDKRKKRILLYEVCDWLEIAMDGKIFDMRFHGGGEEVTDYYILMQYTGLKDKNGKEIYEGDIIEFQEMKYEVYYSNTSFKVRPYPYPLHELHRQDGIIYYGCEVIGNIYENPELIE